MKDTVSNFNFTQSLAPAARTATANGSAVDLSGFNSATFVVNAGAWTDGSHTLKAQESDNNSDWTDVAAGDLNGSFTAITSATQASKLYKIGYNGTKRYVRAVTTVATATSGAVYGVSVMRGHAFSSPVA
jgi:hypothetical protein